MDRYNKIYPNRKSARMIAKEFRVATGKKMDPEFVHWIAEKDPNIHEYYYGGETYYASNLRTIVDAKYYTLYPVFLKEKEERKKKKKQKNVDYNPDAWIEGDTSPRFYVPEGRINKIIREEIEETVRGVLKTNNPNNDSSIKIYHRAGMHTRLSLREVIASICKNGLITSTATDGDGIGKCIWFTTDFDTYGTNGKFVVSMELTDDKIEKYHINCNDFPNAYAYRDIPFNELKIEKMPLFEANVGGRYYFTNLDGVPGNRKNMFDFLIGAASSHKNSRFIMFVDAWDYFNEPYDLEKLNNFANIEVSKIME